MTTPTTAEQVNAVVREFGQGQMVDVLDIDNVRFIAKSTVQTLVHNMAQEILSARATIERLEGELEASHQRVMELHGDVERALDRADAAERRVEAVRSALQDRLRTSQQRKHEAAREQRFDDAAMWLEVSRHCQEALTTLAAASGDTATTEG